MNNRRRPRGNGSITDRMRLIRIELYGDNGGPVLASLLRLPFQTWANYESGVDIPGHVLLTFLDITGTNACWLLRGEGPKYVPKTRTTSTHSQMS
jgi:hypothetical protein